MPCRESPTLKICVAGPKETNMTKKAEQAEEKKLVWKFKDLPNASEVAQLVETEVITPEEARTILFKEEIKQSDEVEALKEMVNTLQEMVKDLLSRPKDIQYIPYTKVVEVAPRYKPYWDRVWMSTRTDGEFITARSDAGATNGSTAYTLSVGNNQ